MSRRLLGINNYFYQRGGAETVFLQHMAMFEGAGWEVVPFAMQHPDNLPSRWSGEFVSEIEYGRQDGMARKLRDAGKVIYSREARDHIARLVDTARPDVAHAHNVYHHLSPAIFPALKERGVPLVMTAHDLKLACPAYLMLSHGKVCERCRGGRIHNVLLHRCMKGSVPLSGLVMLETLVHRTLGLYSSTLDRIVTPSHFLRNKLIEWGWEAGRLVHIPNFVDLEKPRAEDTDESDAYVYVGRLSQEKGVATLIRAAAAAGVRLVIAGTGPDESKLRALAEETGGDVSFAGYLTGADLERLVSSSRAVVLPSECYENAPMSILEAYAARRPVVGARIGGIPELVRPGETGLLAASGDVEDLAERLVEMDQLGSSGRAQMGEAGHAWAAGAFSRSHYLDRTTSLYRELGAA